jgi:hypothetical protein
MRLPRFSIASVLAVIAILAVALAALRSPSYLWANVTFSLSLGALVLAIINVVYGREAGRAYWLGFSLCGGIYFAVCSIPGLRDSVCPRLVTEVVFDFLYPQLSPATTPAPGVINVTTTGTGGSVGQMLVTYRLAVNGGPGSVTPPSSPSMPPWAAWTEPDRSVGVGYQIGTVSLRSSEAFRQIGHSMFTLLVAVLGGTFARHRYRISVMNRPSLESAP